MDAQVMMYLNNEKNWKKTKKKQYSIYVCMPPIGTRVENFLEGAKYTTDSKKRFVLSGLVGEQWVIDANKLAKTYTFDDGTEITPESLSAKLEHGCIKWVKVTTKQDDTIVWSCILNPKFKNVPIQTSWGDTLFANRDGIRHLYGDFIMASNAGGRPNLKDVWVVNGEIFPRTYDLHAYAGKFNPNIMNNTVAEKPAEIKVDYRFQSFDDIMVNEDVKTDFKTAGAIVEKVANEVCKMSKHLSCSKAYIADANYAGKEYNAMISDIYIDKDDDISFVLAARNSKQVAIQGMGDMDYNSMICNCDSDTVKKLSKFIYDETKKYYATRGKSEKKIK